jgi:hypothetical protein
VHRIANDERDHRLQPVVEEDAVGPRSRDVLRVFQLVALGGRLGIGLIRRAAAKACDP